MSLKIPSEISLFEKSYGDEFPDAQYYVLLFKEIGSRFYNKRHYDTSLLTYFYENGFKVMHKYNLDGRGFNKINNLYLINEEKQIMIGAVIGVEKRENLMEVYFLYNLSKGEINEQLDFEEIKKYKREKKKSNISLVKSDRGGLDSEEYDLAVPEIDLSLNYGEQFLKVHEKIVKRLNTNSDKGIILLHGDPGTGKTSYLKYLTKCISHKDILFIPPSMAEMLAEPSIIPFLMEKKNSILIIEDGEKVIWDREANGSSSSVSNLLNLTDGILGDCLNIQVIVTFNMKREKIDQALLRKGRLIVEHKFDKLSVRDTNKLLKHLNKDLTSEIPLSLADIYNIDEDEIRVTTKRKRIGFGQNNDE